jgi:hypothetical protein
MCKHIFIPNQDSLRKGFCKNCQIPLFIYNIDSFGYEYGDIIGPKYNTNGRLIPPLTSVLNPDIHSSWQELLDFLKKCRNNQKPKRKIIIDDE